MNLPQLIIIDDEEDLSNLIGDVAGLSGFEAQQFSNGSYFTTQYNHNADVIVLDLMMPVVDGIEVIRFLAAHSCTAQLILMSGFDSGVLHSAKKLAIEQGLNFAGTLSKPFHIHELQQLLAKIKVRPHLRRPAVSRVIPSAKELQRALNNKELVVYYQPKVALNGSVLPAVEALVRWQHPTQGLLAPDLFIPTAEQHDLIDELTWVVLNQALAQCQLWGQSGLTMQVAVNMSANTLKDLQIPEKMEHLIKYFGLKPSQLILEITESALMQELVKSLDILTRLRIKGIHLSIDDFGTGYSSMVQLHRAPFSEIKIDRSFVATMEEDPEAATIVEIIIMLGHKLNMKVVAEGVETNSCQAILKELTCDRAQGYLFAKPMPARKIHSWFSRFHMDP